jgi:hypothetical protein
VDQLELKVDDAPRRGLSPRRGVVALLVVTALAAGGIGWVIGRAGDQGETFRTKIVKISDDGSSLCVERSHDDCALPIVLPEDRAAIRPGAEVEITEMTLPTDYGSALAFLVRPVK